MATYEKSVKRKLDVVGSLFLLGVFVPLIAAIAVAIRLTMGTPVLFRQPRPGRYERIFVVLKFRTMTNEIHTADADRLTPLGQFLRKASFDELPQILNILRGEMSFVGPRPLATQYLDYYTSEERKRHTVRPGITGLAQVNGRNSLHWEERFRMDVEYVNSVSFKGDLKIVIRTVLKLVQQSDVVVRGTGSIGDFDKVRAAQWETERLRSDTMESGKNAGVES